ncbi:MAG: hypothetical protein AAF657_40760 [Acidobacteriota bacterium]
MLEQLTKDDFEKCLHQTFTVQVEGHGPLETELIEVRSLVAPATDWEHRQPFSLIFRGPMDVPLQQGIFRVDNEAMGSLEIFLVTNGPDNDGMRHESIFS